MRYQWWITVGWPHILGWLQRVK